jgi:hypothetical protein
VKQKRVVTVAESPCSLSDVDSSFGFTNTSKSDTSRNDNIAGVQVGEAEDSKNHAEVKHATDDYNIFEAETQCDVDYFDADKSSACKSHVSIVRREDKICTSAPDQEEDIFEAETQCEEASFTIPVKSFGASDPKKPDLSLREESADSNKEIERDIVNKAEVVPESISSPGQEYIKVRNVNQPLKTDHLAAKDVDNSCTKHGNGLHSSPAQSFIADGSQTAAMDKTDTVSVCSERTEEYAYDEASVSSHEDADSKRPAQETVENKDSGIVTQRRTVCSESQMVRVLSSNKDGQQVGQQDGVKERNSCADTKLLRSVIYNEDSLDRSMLEGDDDMFAFEVTQNADSKAGAFETNKPTEKFSEGHKEDKTKSKNVTSGEPQTELTSLSEQSTVKHCKSSKMLSAGGADKSESHQAQNGSVNISDTLQTDTKSIVETATAINKETVKLSSKSGDRIDVGSIVEAGTKSEESLLDSKKDIRRCVRLRHDSGNEKGSEAKSQINLPPVISSKTVSNRFEPSSGKNSCETSITISGENINIETQSLAGPGNTATPDRNLEKRNKIMEYSSKNNRELTEPQDSLRQDVSVTFTHKLALVSSEKEKPQPNLSHESKGDSDTDVDVFVGGPQILSPVNKAKDIAKAYDSSRKRTTDITAISSSTAKVDAHSNSACEDHSLSDDDNIYEAETQIMETANRSDENVTELCLPTPAERKLNADDDDDDDDMYEAATQIVQTPNKSGEDFAEPFARSAVRDERDGGLDDSDSICEAATQIMQTSNKSGEDFAEPFARSAVRDERDAGLDDSDSFCEAATQIVGSANRTSKDFTEGFAPSALEGKINAGHDNDDDDDDDDIHEAATQIVETTIRNSKHYTEPSKRSSGSVTEGIQVIAYDSERKKLRSSSGSVDEDDFRCPIDPLDDADKANICSAPSQKVHLPGNRVGEHQANDMAISRGSCSVMTKAERRCVGTSQILELNQNLPIQDCENSLITPNAHFDEIAGTKRDTVTNVDGRTSEREQSEVSEDNILGVEKDAGEILRTAESEETETSGINEGRKSGLAESKIQKLAARDQEGETVSTESKKSYDALAHLRRDDENSVMRDLLKADDGTVCAQKCAVGGAEEAPGTLTRAHRNGNREHGVEDSKKRDVPIVHAQKEDGGARGMTESVASTHRDSDESSGLGDAEMPHDNAACGQEPGLAGSEIPDDPHLSPRDDSGDETDPEHVFEADSRQIIMESNSDELSAAQISTLPISSVGTAQKVSESEVICTENEPPSSPSLILPQDTLVSSVSSTEDGKGLTRVAESVDAATPIHLAEVSRKLTSAGSPCSKGTIIVSLAAGSDICDNLLAVPAAQCHIEAEAATVVAKVRESGGESSLSEVSSCSITATVGSPLPQDQSTDNGEGLNYDPQAGMPSDHLKDADQADISPLVGTGSEPHSEGLRPKDSVIKNENDSASYPDVNQQITLENERSVIEEADGIVHQPAKESLNDTQDLIMPSSQDLFKAVKEAEEQESPFKPEELVACEEEEEEQDLTPKIGRHKHLPSKRAKVRKRLSVDCRRSDTAVAVSGRRRTLPYEDSVQDDMTDATVRASKQRKLSGRGSAQNDSKNEATDMTPQRKLSGRGSAQNGSKNEATDMTPQSRAARPDGNSQQSRTENIVSTDDANIGKGRKSRISAVKSKGQGETVSSADLQRDANEKRSLEGSRTETSSRSKVGKREQDLGSEQRDKPRRGRRRLSKQAVESSEGSDCVEAGESGIERCINKNKSEQNSATSSRSPRQRKMTSKIQDSLKGDKNQGSATPEEKPMSRRKGKSSSNSQNDLNGSAVPGTGMTVRSGSGSSSRSPTKKLLKTSEDSNNDICKDLKETEGRSSIPREQNVPVRKSTRQSKGDKSVTSVTNPPEINSPQRKRRQNDGKDLSSNAEKLKTEETCGELPSKRSKRGTKLIPVETSRKDSADKCSPKRRKTVLNTDEGFEGVCEFSTRASMRKETQAASIGLMQQQSAFVSSTDTATTEHKKGRTSLKKTSSSVGSAQGSTRSCVRGRQEDTDTSPPCPKDLNMSESLNASHRTRRSAKRTKPSAEQDSEHSPLKQARHGKTSCEPLSHESGTEDVKVQRRTSRARGKATSPQKLATRGVTKQEVKPGQRERTRKTSKTEENDKPLTPRSRKMNVSEGQDTPPRHTRSSQGTGTPQSSSQKVRVPDTIVSKDNRRCLRGFDNYKNELSS